MGRPTRSRLLSCAVVSVLAALTLVGCAPTTGVVEVQVAANAPAAGFSVRIVDAHGRTVGRTHLAPGQSQGFAHVPLGHVAVSAAGSCTLSATLVAGSTFRAIFGDKRCTLA